MEEGNEMAYIFSDFCINSVDEIPRFHSVEGLNEIGKFFDYAMDRSIRTQAIKNNISFVSPEDEKRIATEALSRFVKGESKVFTRTDGLREEMEKVGSKKIVDMLVNHMIELHAVNCEVHHQLKPQNFEGECASYITGVAYQGGLNDESFKSWLSSDEVISTLAGSYVQTKYKNDNKKSMMEQVAWSNPVTTKAKEQLNLQMKLDEIAKTSSTEDNLGGYGGK